MSSVLQSASFIPGALRGKRSTQATQLIRIDSCQPHEPRITAMVPRAGVLLCLISSCAAFTLPTRHSRHRWSLAANADDDRMYEYYKKKWSKAAADDWLAGRQRDRGAYSAKNAKRLGARPGEEYDLGSAMDANTDDTITKIIAGAAIVSIISGLFFGVLQPLLAPPTIVGDDGTVYTKVNGGFVEK